MTTATVDQPAGNKRFRKRTPVGDHAAGVVAGLQARLLRDRVDAEAVAALARLRRAIGREPGADYSIERYVLVPEDLIDFIPKDGPGDAEYAVHDAVTLYALHQQSQRQQMHRSGDGLGTAVSVLVSKSSGPEGVRRRFAALGTAGTYQEVIYHLRNLITMLRAHEIPLDYGLLADDLLTLRKPYGASRVQAAWGREFFRRRPTGESGTTSSITDNTEDDQS